MQKMVPDNRGYNIERISAKVEQIVYCSSTAEDECNALVYCWHWTSVARQAGSPGWRPYNLTMSSVQTTGHSRKVSSRLLK